MKKLHWVLTLALSLASYSSFAGDRIFTSGKVDDQFLKNINSEHLMSADEFVFHRNDSPSVASSDESLVNPTTGHGYGGSFGYGGGILPYYGYSYGYGYPYVGYGYAYPYYGYTYGYGYPYYGYTYPYVGYGYGYSGNVVTGNSEPQPGNSEPLPVVTCFAKDAQGKMYQATGEKAATAQAAALEACTNASTGCQEAGCAQVQ